MLPDHLSDPQLREQPVKYKYDLDINNKFFSPFPFDDDEVIFREPLLNTTPKATYGLVIACTEWITARLSSHVDTSDALLRIEAAWAGMIDPRYATLPEPDDPDVDEKFIVTGPAWASLVIMGDCLQAIENDWRNVPFQTVISVGMLATLVCDQYAPFEKWVKEILIRLPQHYPKIKQPIQEELPVPREFYYPNWKPGTAESDTFTHFLSQLDPDKNEYLRSEARLKEEGIPNPYPGRS
jgi:hypothetical protein